MDDAFSHFEEIPMVTPGKLSAIEANSEDWLI
jgi:hypothetical protein